MTDISLACKNNDIKKLKKIIKSIEKNLKERKKISDTSDRTGFIYACESGNFEMVKLLIEAGANVHRYDGLRCNGFLYACKNDYFKIVDLLIKSQHVETLTLTLEPGLQLGIRAFWKTGKVIVVNDKCQKPLKQLGTGEDWKIVSVDGEPYNESLLDKKMTGKVSYQLTFIKNLDIEAKDGNGYPGFIHACYNNNLALVNLLIKSGINIEAQDNKGNTGFLWACGNGNIEIINLLIQSGVNIDVKNNHGYNGFIYACESNFGREIIDLLIQSGMQIDLNNQKLQNIIMDNIITNYFYNWDELNTYWVNKSDILISFLDHNLFEQVIRKIIKNPQLIQGYVRSLKEKCQIEIQKYDIEYENVKHIIKNIWPDVELLVIDIICDFSKGGKILEKVLLEILEE